MIFASPMTVALTQGHNCVSNWTFFFSLYYISNNLGNYAVQLGYQKVLGTGKVVFLYPGFFLSEQQIGFFWDERGRVCMCVCLFVCLSLASDSSETIDVIITKLGTATASARECITC